MKIPQIAITLIKDAADQMSNNICNDYYIADTPANRKFLIELNRWNDDEDFNIEDAVDGHKRLFCTDWMVLEYIAHLLEQQK